MIDAHIHLDQYDLNSLPEQIEVWKEGGIKRVIAVSSDLASSYQTLELRQKYPHFVSACVGFHPEKPIPHRQEIDEFSHLVNSERSNITAIGEIGLPHYQLEHLIDSFEHYVDMLHHYLHIAKRHNLPVLLHAVHDKAEIAFEMVCSLSMEKVHFHWLKAPISTVDQIIQAGYYISVTPEICYRQRDMRLAERVPLEQLLIETDGPWPFNDRFANRPTTPLFLTDMISQLSQIKRISPETILDRISANIKACYGV